MILSLILRSEVVDVWLLSVGVGRVDVGWVGGEQGWRLPGSVLVPWDALSCLPHMAGGSGCPGGTPTAGSD